MNYRRYLPYIQIVAGASLFVFVGLLPSTKVSAHGGLPSCTPAAVFMQPAPSTTTHNLSGVVPIDFMTAPDATRVIFELNGKIIGKGQSMSPNNDAWHMVWDTRYSNPTNHANLTAEVTYTSGQVCKSTSIVTVAINNPTVFNLTADLLPPYWQGPTNSVGWFNIAYNNESGSTIDMSPFAVIDWSVSGVGTITQQPNGVGRYYSGPQPGMGTLTANIDYGGGSTEVSAIVDVIGQYPNSTTDNSGGTGSSGNNDANNSTTEGESNPTHTATPSDTTRTPSPVSFADHVQSYFRSNQLVSSCVSGRLGDSAQSFTSGSRRLLSSEFNALKDCFADQKYVVPSIFVPVAPEEVVRKKRSDAVKIGTIVNRDISTESGGTQKALVLSGTAAPRSTVIIYIFSEPLVLVATANDEGLWEYTLEDPLPGGEHEVYALIDRGDGEYERSNLASFFIGTAEATEENPNGLSLELVSEPTIDASNRSANIFVAATIGLIVFVSTLFAGFLVYRFRNRAQLEHHSGGYTIAPHMPTDKATPRKDE